jgi:hypothetical protein
MSHVQRVIPKRAMFDADYGPHLHRIGDPRNEDDGSQECPGCEARGWRWVLHDDNSRVRVECEVCEGARYLDEFGYPVKESDE